MPNEQEPVVNTETASEVNGSPAEGSATPPVTPEVTPEPVQVNPELDAYRLRAEEAEKKANQASMRANQLENERKEAERQKLVEANEYQKLYEDTAAELKARDEQIERETTANEAKSLRDTAIDSYPDERVRTAAKKLVAKNDSYFYWGENVASEAAAQAEVKAQLDVFAESFGPAPAVTVTPAVIDANNPLEGRDSVASEQQDALRERLGNVIF